MIGILKFIRKLKLRNDARYYITQFLESTNGKKALLEATPHQMLERKKITKRQLIDAWLPAKSDLEELLRLQVVYQSDTGTVPQSTLLFDEVFRLPFDNYDADRVEGMIAIQVVTALLLSGQESELGSNLLVFITEQHSNEFIGMSAYQFKVCKVSDFGSLFHTTHKPPAEVISLS